MAKTPQQPLPVLTIAPPLPEALAYATPPSPRRGRPLRGSVLSLLAILLGVIGLIILLRAIAILIRFFHTEIDSDFMSDLFEMIVELIIGGSCAKLAIAWLGDAYKMIGGADIQ